MGGHFRSIVGWSRLSNWLALVWVIAWVAGPFLGYPPALRLMGLAAMAGSLGCFITYEVLKTRITKQVLIQFAVIAQRGRQQRLTREYQRYLTAVS